MDCDLLEALTHTESSDPTLMVGFFYVHNRRGSPLDKTLRTLFIFLEMIINKIGPVFIKFSVLSTRTIFDFDKDLYIISNIIITSNSTGVPGGPRGFLGCRDSGGEIVLKVGSRHDVVIHVVIGWV